MIDGKPSYVVAYLAFKDLPTADPVNTSTAIQLPRIGETNVYHGVAVQAKHHLGGKATVDFDDNTALLEVELWKEGSMTESEEFEDVDLGHLPHWDSHLQVAIHISPDQDWIKIRIWS